ncbi:MAG TPA: preprotein translocase subunit YajC [Actinoplanes sp.]|nr:preprotein translocase subunit YajC [Actinoplanes sp.]
MSLAAEPSAGGGGFTPLLLIVLLFAVMYFMMIRPQQKRRREAEQMQKALGPGDEIVTIGGLHATVVSIDDDVATVEIAPGVNVRFARPAIARVLKREVVADDESTEAVADDPAVESPAAESPVVETKKSKD